tara:strand:- start:1041 stop:1661 length:621 start_codon:yes stop_codon:yes gene_type:complete
MIIDFLTHEANAPYLFSLALLVVFFVVEVLGLLVGMSISHALDGLIDFDVDSDMGGHLSVLGLGKVPLMVWLMFFLGIFTILGYGLNIVVSSVIGFTPSVYVSVLPVLAVTIYLNRIACGIFSKLVPLVETDSVDTDSFEGKVAKITLGHASNDRYAMGIVLDIHGNSHNIRIKPMGEDELLEGSEVILVERISDSNLWHAISYKK